jgi:O-antigen/teichoic acid export membrane protein
MALLFASEILAAALGFGVTLGLAHRLGPLGFADYEFALAVAGWWLVVVRGGFDTIAYREAARRPRLIGPLTDALIGLRATSAVVGLAAVAAFAWASGGERGWVVAMAGLTLIPSALARDVAPRALGRFGVLALAQSVRAVGLALAAACLVGSPRDAWIAAACVAAAEVGSAATLWGFDRTTRKSHRPRIRLRVWAAVARRGGIAGVSRFARVGLYAADLLALGLLASASLGPYSAARRLAFALLALGLVVPAAVGPKIARAWAEGADEARSLVASTLASLLRFALPATVGLMATADRWMPRLFGPEFQEAGPWLALVAARLPFVLASNVQQAALVACRREKMALRLILGMVGVGALTLPVLAIQAGPWGVGLGMLAVETGGAVAGWFALRSMAIAPPWHHASGPSLVGCGAIGLVCWLGRGWPLATVVGGGAAAYAACLLALSREPSQRLVPVLFSRLGRMRPVSVDFSSGVGRATR